jgi:hypothetical protein
MRNQLLCAVVLAWTATGCGDAGTQDRGECRAPVSGGTAAQRQVVNDVFCASGSTPAKIRIAPAPGGLPKGAVELVIDSRVPPEPDAQTGKRAAEADAARESAY